MPNLRSLTREDWIAQARRALVRAGVDDVKVNRLARRMKVTRGSFYHHFSGVADLLNALLADWEARNHGEIALIRERWARAEPDLSEIIAIWLGEEPGFLAFDIAVRGWARKAPSADEAVKRVDAAWLDLLQDLFRIGGFDEDESLVRARVCYFHQIGYHAVEMREVVAERLRLVPIYYHVLTGKRPGAQLETVIEDARRWLDARADTKAAQAALARSSRRTIRSS